MTDPTRDEIEDEAEYILAVHEDAVEDYCAGEDEAVNFLVAQVRNRLDGRGDPATIEAVLLELMDYGVQPESVSVELEPESLPDRLVDEWCQEWEEMDIERKAVYGGSRAQYLHEQTVDWMRNLFMEAQGHNDLHHWVDAYEVSWDV